MNMQEFLKNRQKLPAQELEKYVGMYVAWRPDGAAIIASDKDELHLDTAVRAAGYHPADVLISFVPPFDQVILGGTGAAE